MISIDVNSLNNLAEVEKAIEKLSFVRDALRKSVAPLHAFGTPIAVEPYAPPFKDPQEAIQDDGIVCLIDGEKRKFLGRYVRTVHGMEWPEYLERFDLPADYPQTCSDVIAQRAAAAIARGLGKHRRPREAGQQVQVTVPVRRSFGRRRSPQVSVKVGIGGTTVTAKTDSLDREHSSRSLRKFL